jgi:pre-mRNA-splicing factor ATP-dependent RNA helicase DHX15/PRP43
MVSAPNSFFRPTDAQQATVAAKASCSHIDADHLPMLCVYHAFKQKRRGYHLVS